MRDIIWMSLVFLCVNMVCMGLLLVRIAELAPTVMPLVGGLVALIVLSALFLLGLLVSVVMCKESK